MEFSKTQKTFTMCCMFIFAVSVVFIGYKYIFLFFTLVFLIASVYKKLFSYKFAIICFLIFVASIFYTHYKIPKADELYYAAPINAVMQGRIVSFPKQDDEKLKFEFQIDHKILNNKKISAKSKTLVTIFDKEKKFKNLKIGDRITISGLVKRPYAPTNPAQFDYKKYLKNTGIFTVTSVKHDKYSLLEKPKYGKWFFIQKANETTEKILDVHKTFLKSSKLEIMGGIVFGSTAINPSMKIKADFINSGLYHLLAASGMNVGFIFAFWYFICKKLSMPSKFSIISGGLVVILYSIMTGLPSSVLRATGMLEFILLGKLIDREADNIALLALVCVMLLIYNPLFLNDIGFQLSFLVTFGLLLCVSPLMEKIKFLPGWLSGCIVIPFVAQVWAAPIQIFYFNTFAPYSIIANILVMPFNAIITFGGFIGSVFALIPFVGTYLCGIADKISEPFISLLLLISGYFSGLPHSLMYFGKPQLIQVVIFYLLVLGAVFMIKMNFKERKLNLLTGILVLILFIFPINKSFSKDLSFVFFNVGEGDSILIQTPEKKYILVDTGTRKKYSSGIAKTTIIPYLQDEGIKKLDALVLTHPDSDHIGGTVDILENIKVDKIYSNGETSDTKAYKEIENELAKKHMAITTLKNGDELTLDDKIEIKTLIPEDTNAEIHNDNSIILLLRYNKFSTILMADNEVNSLKLLSNSLNEAADVLKVGHHGSQKSLNYNILDLLKPKVAVISVGKNSYGHPAYEILKLLEQFSVKTLRTDEDNSIKINSNGKIFKVYQFEENKHKWKNIVKQTAD